MRSKKTDPTGQDMNQARAFAQWQRAARERMGWNMSQLAVEAHYSGTQIRLYDADAYAGIDSTGRYRQPKREYVEAIGAATKMHPDTITEGLQHAGLLLPPSPQPYAMDDMKPVTLSTGEVFYLRPDETDPDAVINALETWLTGYRAGAAKQRRN